MKPSIEATAPRSSERRKEAIAVFDGVSYLYPRTQEPALNEINLSIPRGEFLGVIGPTGAGKTTLCLTLNGIVPQAFGGRFFGYVMVAGLDTLNHPISTMARHVGMVFEDPDTQLTATSVENEIAFALENLSVPRDEIRRRISWALEIVRLEGREHRHPFELSGGEKQRLAIAAALALRPEILVLDEPTSQLDPVGVQEVFAILRELNRTLGITVVIAGHAAEEMAEHTDRLVLLDRGELVTTGTPEAVYGDVERLVKVGLRPPQVTETFYLLGSRRPPELPVRLEDGLRLLRTWPRTHACQAATCGQPATPAPPVSPSQLTAAPVLAAQALHHTYADGTPALKGISLEIHRGEYVLIAGQNGAGKSTLVKHFLNLLQPTLGTTWVNGSDTRRLRMSDLARTIGYVAQNPDHQIFTATVEDEVAFALRHLDTGRSTDQVNAAVTRSLEAVSLLDVRDRHPLALPKGDRTRVIIAAVLAMEPEILIFDEPTMGQDDQGAQVILDITRRLHQQGKTVVTITHHLHLMPAYAERMILMGKGVKLLDAPIREAFHDVDLLAATYLTPPQAVWLARALCETDETRASSLVTPAEVAGCLVGQDPTMEVRH